MDRLDILAKMKKLGMKHYIVSICHLTAEGHKTWWKDWGFEHCHYTEESFDAEIKRLERQGYNFFDVIHAHV